METLVEHDAENFCAAIENTIARLNEAREQVAPKLESATERYVEHVERDAVAMLNRPRWLLSRSIASKIKNYRQNQKIFAIAGVKRKTTGSRDPGVYWKYHESGSTPDGYRRAAPSHFLKTAKERNIGQFEREVSEAFEEFREIYRRGS